MCGIAGVFGRAHPQTVPAMLGTLVHRGPDDGFWVGHQDFSLGARRLSIQDVEGGRQPMCNEGGDVWAVQNGELYTYPDLRQTLLARGHALRTHCDTEVLPHLYEDFGDGLAERIDGMFAVAVWDDRNKVGFLARDRTGKKPLYYCVRGDALYFASEVKGLLRIPGFERRINLEALHHYLSYKHVPHPLSIFQGVSILPPGHTLTFRPTEAPVVRRYWRPDFTPDPETARMDEEEAVNRLLDLLRLGVKRRLISDVPIGFFLSGGIDSSLSTALAAELSSERIKTFCLTYGGDSTTEGKELDRKWSRWVAGAYDTEHHEEAITFSSFPESLRAILTHFDEPFAGVVSTYFLARRVAQHVKVALSGDGADELFGSYLSHRLAFPMSRYEAYRKTGDSSLIHPYEQQPELLGRLWEGEDWAWRAKLLVFGEEQKHSLYHPDVRGAMRSFNTSEHLRAVFSSLTAQDPLNRILEAEFRTIFPDQVLTFVDRLSMAHSLEVRTAYLDTDVVEYVSRLPGHFKIKDGVTKYILKRAALRYFPEEMVSRPKEGFLMPVTQWILQDLQPYVRETLSQERLRQHGLFDYAQVVSLIDQLYQAGAAPDYTHVNRVLALIVFQEWYEMYMVPSAESVAA